MDFGFWYDVATYGNANWKGNFTPKEIAESTYEYLCEWEATLSECEVTPNIDNLMHQLHEDYCNGSTEALELLESIIKELECHGIKWFID